MFKILYNLNKKRKNILLEDGSVYCCRCNGNFTKDHFYITKSKNKKERFNCRRGRPKKKKSKLTILEESLGVERKKGSKALFHIPMEDGRIYCGNCKQLFNECHFHIIKYENRKYNNEPVTQYTCKENDIRFSELNPSRLYGSNYKNSTKNYRKDASLRREYDITLDIYLQMLNEQNSCCAICGISEHLLKKPLFIDHCHKTGKVRGLLCNTCNGGIGLLKDSIEIIEKASKYLKKFKE